MSENKDKPFGDLCLMCEHFVYIPGDPGYSTLTPGSDTAIYCAKSHWSDSDSWDAKDFRATLRKARTCPDYKQVTDA